MAGRGRDFRDDGDPRILFLFILGWVLAIGGVVLFLVLR